MPTAPEPDPLRQSPRSRHRRRRPPFADTTFDKVYAVDSFRFWPTPADDLREVRRGLRAEGALVFALPIRTGTRGPAGDGAFTRQEAAEAERLVRAAGFSDVDRSRHRLLRDTVHCVHARP